VHPQSNVHQSHVHRGDPMSEMDRRHLLGSLIGGLMFSQMLNATEVPSAVLDASQLSPESRPYGERKVYIEGSTNELKNLLVSRVTLKAGLSPHPPHSHPDGEILVVAEGTGEGTIEGKVSRLQPGSVLYAEPNVLHGLVNTGTSPMIYYVFRWLAK
jgi:quercetin dioxygenase-like cupin family protein